MLGLAGAFGYRVNHGDSCAQGCFTPNERYCRAFPPVRRIKPPASGWRGRFRPDVGEQGIDVRAFRRGPGEHAVLPQP
jgi:hypothetical protein